MASIRKRKLDGGKFVYYVDFYHEGRRVRKSLKISDKKEAELIAKDLEVKLAKGAWGFEDVGGKSILLADYIREYQEHSEANKSRRTCALSELALRYFKEIFGNIPLAQIKTKMGDDYKIIRSSKVSNTTINIELRALKAALEVAVKWGYLEKNPFKGISFVKVKEERPKFLEKDQIERVLDAVTDPQFRDLIRFYLYTGCRRAEAVYLEWKDVDLKNGVIHIRNKEDFTTKTGKERTIHISSKLRQLLSEMGNNTRYVFEKNERPLNIEQVSRRFSNAVKKAGLDDSFTLNSLRHTCASHLVMEGVDLRTVKEILGHSSINTTMIYSHLTPRHVKSALDKLPY